MEEEDQTLKDERMYHKFIPLLTTIFKFNHWKWKKELGQVIFPNMTAVFKKGDHNTASNYWPGVGLMNTELYNLC